MLHVFALQPVICLIELRLYFWLGLYICNCIFGWVYIYV